MLSEDDGHAHAGVTRDEALSRANLAELLETVGDSRGLRTVRGKYPCPELAHAQSGSTPPVGINNRQGTDVWYCHVCEKGGTYIDALVASGRSADIADALTQMGVDPATPRQSSGGSRALGSRVAEYVYTDEAGEPLYQVVRFEPKDFRQERREGNRFVPGMQGVRLVPYRLPQVLAAIERHEWVFIVEGEKDVRALEAAGRVATTSPGGAKKWRDDYTQLLARRDARIIVVADDDAEGHKHARQVERALFGKVGVVLVRRPGRGFKDVADQLAAGVPVNSETLRKLPEPVLKNGERIGGGPGLLSARAMSARPSLGAVQQVVGPLFQRGMRTTIGAQTGDGKTTLSLQAIKALVNGEAFLDGAWRPHRPGKALIIDLEQGEETLKRRLREAGLDNSEAVDVLWEPAGLALDSDGEHQELVRDIVARGGYDLVLVDPLYQMHRGNANDERTAADLMRLVDGWARDYNFSLIIPMHARKPHPQAGKQMTIHDIAGSSSWNRNAEFVMGMQLMSAGNSRLWFFKDRIGDGPGIPSTWWLAFDRDGEGFKHVAAPHENAAERRAAIEQMLARPDGCTIDELERVGASEPQLRKIRRECYENPEGRWRALDWNQATLDIDTALSNGNMM